MSLDSPTRDRIATLVEDNPVLLFMKGNRSAPQCGFSATVVRVLDSLIPDYQTVDVLSDPEIREGIKLFSDWPTIPQLYVKGEFVGGCDIIQELFETGELQETLGIETGEVATPSILITPAAVEALRRAVDQAGSPAGELHLSVDAGFRGSLAISPVRESDMQVESNGFTLYLDRMSAGRAEGITLDVEQTPNGPGFKINNPNAPQVREITVADLRKLMDETQGLELLDVRTPEERATASIPNSVLMTDIEADRLSKLPKDSLLVFYCHSGRRSHAAAEHFASQGFSNVCNVVGGIEAWSQEIDPSVPRY